MDFLDPRKRRKHRIYLMIGYGLMTILIALGTVILVYSASGYGINTKTGDIIENGLLFVGSKPGGAEIYLNGQDRHATTSARLVLPAGSYDLTLKKSGYLDWQRRITLNPQTVDRFVYPFLFPASPVTTQIKSYASLPPLVTQSPDRHWLLVQTTTGSSGSLDFDEYDLTNLQKPPVALSLPAEALAKGGHLKTVEWSDDNRHVLLEHDYAGGKEFVIFDRSKPQNSVNVNRALKVTPVQVALRDKKTSQLYIYQKASIRLADMGHGTLAPPLLTHVLAFKPSGPNLIAYITNEGQPHGQVQARIWDGKNSYILDSFKTGKNYLIDYAKYSGNWYYVVGSNTSAHINLYKNPLSQLNGSSVSNASAVLDMHVAGATRVSFSDNARFVEVEAGQKFAVYDAEFKALYRYTLKQPLSAAPQWMDGHRLISYSKGQILVMDYDSANLHLLAPTRLAAGGYFGPDFNQLYTFQPVKGSKQAVLVRIDMRAGKDLPAS